MLPQYQQVICVAMALVHIIMSFEPTHAQVARNFTLKTTKDDLKIVEKLIAIVDEDVPLFFTNRN